MSEQVKDLRDVPSFPAIMAAALAPRPGTKRRRTLPEGAYRVRSVRIDPRRAADFDHLMGGVATDIVHPGVLHVLAFPVALSLMAQPGFPVPLLGLVHVSNSLLQHRPVRVGEKVDVESRVRRLRPHRRGATFEAVSTISDADGIIATDVSTYLAKGTDIAGRPEEPEKGEGAGARDGSRSRGKEVFAPPVASGRWRLGADAGRRYAAVSGDANPIHLSRLTARAFGFPAAIAHGMYTASRAFTESRIDLHRPLRWDVEFGAPVTLPGTVLVAYDDVSDQRDGDARRTVRCVGWKPGKGAKTPRKCFESEVTELA